MTSEKTSLFESRLVNEAIKHSFRKLNPRFLIKNPVMFTVEIGTVVVLVVTLFALITGDKSQGSVVYNFLVFFILLITLLFANFAEAIAEARGKAQADNLRKTREETPARVFNKNGQISIISSSELKKGDVFMCVEGDIIPTDGEIIEGLATIDESAITGESAPVIRESGGDRLRPQPGLGPVQEAAEEARARRRRQVYSRRDQARRRDRPRPDRSAPVTGS